MLRARSSCTSSVAAGGSPSSSTCTVCQGFGGLRTGRVTRVARIARHGGARMADATTLECPCCGHVLAVTPDVGENALAACAHCGMVIRNCTGSRAFRWSMVDPYVRRHGASKANLWGGLLGSLAWIPVLALVMAITGR